jgi:hypothetical protein
MRSAKELGDRAKSMAPSTIRHLRTFISKHRLVISIANFWHRTCQYEGTGFADALGYVGSGDYLSDTVVLGGVSVKDMYFGYTSSYSFPDKLRGDTYTILGKILR